VGDLLEAAEYFQIAALKEICSKLLFDQGVCDAANHTLLKKQCFNPDQHGSIDFGRLDLDPDPGDKKLPTIIEKG
jgi:hypothetical protein